MLMSVATDKKHIILDKHPDLDVSNIDLKLVGLSVAGPKSRDTLQKLVDKDISNNNFKALWFVYDNF